MGTPEGRHNGPTRVKSTVISGPSSDDRDGMSAPVSASTKVRDNTPGSRPRGSATAPARICGAHNSTRDSSGGSSSDASWPAILRVSLGEASGDGGLARRAAHLLLAPNARC